MPAAVAELTTKLKDRLQQESFHQILAKLLENHARSQVASHPSKSSIESEHSVALLNEASFASPLTSSSFETVVTQTRPEGFALKRGDFDENTSGNNNAGKKKKNKKKSVTTTTTTTTTTPKPGKNKTFEKEIDRLLEKIERLEKEQSQTTTTETPSQFQPQRGPPTVIANKIKKFMEAYNPDAAAAALSQHQNQQNNHPDNEDEEEDDVTEATVGQRRPAQSRQQSPHSPQSWIPDSAGAPQPMPTPPPGFPRPPPGMPPLPFMPFMPPHPMMQQPGAEHYNQYPPQHYYPQQPQQEIPVEEQQSPHPYDPSPQVLQFDPSDAQQQSQQQYDPNQEQQVPYDPNQMTYDPNQVPYDPNQANQQPAQYDPNMDANQQMEANSQQYQQDFNSFQQQAVQYEPQIVQPITEAPKKSFFRRKFKLSSLFNSVIPKTKKQKQKAEMLKQQQLQLQQQQQMQQEEYANQNYVNTNRDTASNQPQDHMVAGESQMYGNVDRGHGYAMEQPGFSVSMGAGPMGGGGHVKASPLGIVKTLLQPFSGRPKWINGKIVLGVVLENGIGKKPKTVFQHFSTGRI